MRSAALLTALLGLVSAATETAAACNCKNPRVRKEWCVFSHFQPGLDVSCPAVHSPFISNFSSFHRPFVMLLAASLLSWPAFSSVNARASACAKGPECRGKSAVRFDTDMCWENNLMHNGASCHQGVGGLHQGGWSSWKILCSFVLFSYSVFLCLCYVLCLSILFSYAYAMFFVFGFCFIILYSEFGLLFCFPVLYSRLFFLFCSPMPYSGFVF
jgi:hypothetical protein